MKKNYVKIVLICMLGVFLSNCEDGEIGPAGKDGINGTDGTNGTNGNNGENGEGFEELAKYGNIQLTIKGKRPDGVDINDTSSFKFASIHPESSAYIKQDNQLLFNIERFISAPSSRYASVITLNLEVTDSGTENQVISQLSVIINKHRILSEDLDAFEFSRGYNIQLPLGDRDDISNFSITNYSFNEETNNLKFSFSMDVLGRYNPTGNNISIAGEVDVTVLNFIGNTDTER